MKPARPVSITEAARNLSEFVNRVAYRGERYFLVRGKRQVAELRPVPQPVTRSDWPALLRACPGLDTREANAYLADIRKQAPPSQGRRRS